VFGTRFKRFLNYWYKALLNCGYSLKNSIVRQTKIATFWPTKDNLFCVTHNDCRRQPLVFKQVKTFLPPPNLTAHPPQTPGLDLPLASIYFAETSTGWHFSGNFIQTGNEQVHNFLSPKFTCALLRRLSQFFNPLLGRTRSRDRCWAAMWLSHHPESSSAECAARRFLLSDELISCYARRRAFAPGGQMSAK